MQVRVLDFFLKQYSSVITEALVIFHHKSLCSNDCKLYFITIHQILYLLDKSDTERLHSNFIIIKMGIQKDMDVRIFQRFIPGFSV